MKNVSFIQTMRRCAWCLDKAYGCVP